MKYTDLTRKEQYQIVFNAGQKKKLLNRKLMSVLKDLKQLSVHVDEFEPFKGEGHTKLDPIKTQADVHAYYAELKSRLKGLDPTVDLWIENHDEATS